MQKHHAAQFNYSDYNKTQTPLASICREFIAHYAVQSHTVKPTSI